MGEQNNDHAGKRYKPPANHPWRKMVNSEVARWAKDQSDQPKVTNYLKGGGKPQK